jgi:hypothetical protein
MGVMFGKDVKGVGGGPLLQFKHETAGGELNAAVL